MSHVQDLAAAYGSGLHKKGDMPFEVQVLDASGTQPFLCKTVVKSKLKVLCLMNC